MIFFVGDISGTLPKIIRNPNKAVVTLDARTSRILMANSIACMMFGYKEHELVGTKMSQLLSHSRDQQEALGEEILNTDGQAVVINGKVVSRCKLYDSND